MGALGTEDNRLKEDGIEYSIDILQKVYILGRGKIVESFSALGRLLNDMCYTVIHYLNKSYE